MVSIIESEQLGNIINELEALNNTIQDESIRNKIIIIIEQFDEVVC